MLRARQPPDDLGQRIERREKQLPAPVQEGVFREAGGDGAQIRPERGLPRRAVEDVGADWQRAAGARPVEGGDGHDAGAAAVGEGVQEDVGGWGEGGEEGDDGGVPEEVVAGGAGDGFEDDAGDDDDLGGGVEEAEAGDVFCDVFGLGVEPGGKKNEVGGKNGGGKVGEGV